MANVDALDTTLAILRDLGRIENVDEVHVEALRIMAGQLDHDPSNAALWRQYREALKELMADDGNGSLDDEIQDLYSAVRDTPPP